MYLEGILISAIITDIYRKDITRICITYGAMIKKKLEKILPNKYSKLRKKLGKKNAYLGSLIRTQVPSLCPI